ncbi:hypothetical protein J4E83_008649 [Alternaria metachromatica]|uniref:uncharacterized protein n=1 Tax=Alternaria metachromatica TaxID=283354 RepID=UPI0020C2794C|nr:uncharacterized protein J4E83_008649 [Alternaria metachromatica]KAI4609480.1 hypothetical protein J4E83_008649 [Alternaria metachromatica]
MHFHTALFALVTAATAANAKVYGKWNVTISQYALDSGFKSQRLLADFVSDEYSGKDVIHTVCNYEYDPSKNATESKSCDPPTFDYEYDGETVKVQQNIEKPNKMTVFGDAPLTLKKDESVEGVYSNGVFIDADRATA